MHLVEITRPSLTMSQLPQFPYGNDILQLYVQDQSNPIWNAYPKIKQWQKELNEYILALYRDQVPKGETFYAMQDGRPILAQYD